MGKDGNALTVGARCFGSDLMAIYELRWKGQTTPARVRANSKAEAFGVILRLLEATATEIPKFPEMKRF